jgi:hypothetical protein
MNPRTPENDWSQIEDLFHRALEQPEDRQSAWLAHQTSDTRIRGEVESLLSSLKTQDNMPRRDTPASHSTVLPGDSFGGHQLLGLLGRGGTALYTWLAAPTGKLSRR